MGSESVIVGSVATDAIIDTIDLPGTYPHGIAVHQGIDRILVTSTVRHTDLGDPGEILSVIKASTNEVLDSIKVSNKPSPSGEAPVEVLFVPGADPAVAYVTNMFGGSLWTATWNEASQGFDAAEAFSFAELEVGVPLEIYFNDAVDRLYVTTSSPGRFHIFDISGDSAKPELLKTLEIAEGAHHVAVTKDEKLAFVQTTFLNLPGMSDGTIKVVDLEKGEVIGAVDTLKNQGFSPTPSCFCPSGTTFWATDAPDRHFLKLPRAGLRVGVGVARPVSQLTPTASPRTGPISSLRTRSANPSSGVGSRLRITSRAPLRLARAGKSAAG